ncbi:type II secretion system minor pseudopilin GspK [Caldimonas sp. KR1-144]|uniref:type II secretion system minor pseudopilin GspK n=1 Tax=Caldimonas sp. KR1-144 TaxID=3400911 RepID=UPI003C010C90
MNALGHRHGRQRGAALLTAMVIVTLVATLASAIIWQQWRAIQVEAAERARVQARWVLIGAIDWARLILREDARTGGPDHLAEPWAVPLAEARLSTFLAADRDNTAEDDGPDAYLSGAIADAQSRYNLRNLSFGDDAAAEVEQRILARLLDTIGANPALAATVAAELRRALPSGAAAAAASAAGDGNVIVTADPQAAIAPARLEQLTWCGLDAETLRRLAPYVVWLPTKTTVNLNTASREVIAATIEGIDLASADRLVQARQRTPFRSLQDARSLLPAQTELDAARVGVSSAYFEVSGRLRLDERVVEQHAWLVRRGLDVQVFAMEQRNAVTP